MDLKSNPVLADPTPIKDSMLGIHSALLPYTQSTTAFSPALFLTIPRKKTGVLDDVLTSAWLDAMIASSPTHKKVTKGVSTEQLPSEHDIAHCNWLLKYPSALASFEQITNCAKGRRIALFLDYDGTLSPIVDNPDRAFMSNCMRAAVRNVAKYFPTAIISGRSRDKVYDFVGLTELYYAGSHGMDIMGPVRPVTKDHAKCIRSTDKQGKEVNLFQPASKFLPMIDEVFRSLVEITKDINGAKVENNKFCVSVHYRNVDEKNWTAIGQSVADLLKNYQHLRLTHGRKVLEVRPVLDWDKGKAVEFLLESLGLSNSDDVLPIYIGDDRTDEDAFKVLKEGNKGIGILVSSMPKESNAFYSLRDPTEKLNNAIRVRLPALHLKASSMDSVNNVKKKLRKAKKQASRVNSKSLEQMELLPWSKSAPGIDDDPSAFIGSNNELELDGGFFSLEEIDEKDYGLEIPRPEWKNQVKNSEGKKRKRQKGGDETEGGSDEVLVEESNKVGGDEVQKKAKRKTKKRNKKEKRKILIPNDAPKESATPLVDGTQGENGFEEDSVDENDYYAWSSLRLHPLLMKSIMRLKFKEPTLIQKSCIPAAAHQGKDVIGAAETGSGKTLAFGLPILQRLLEEREKDDRLIAENGETDRKNASDGYLRALIITPTRELALQVTDHLKEVAKGTNIRVVPVVGGMSCEKQERVLKSRPEVVVGTPGRLWELMSGGAIHLVELHSLSFFVLDEADRMIESGHFRELQSIIDMLPMKRDQSESQSQIADKGLSVSSIQKKKRQTFVFSATIALSTDFRKKLKRGSLKSKLNEGLNSIETLSERAGIRENAAIIDLTNASILVGKLAESFIQCTDENKDAYLYYILGVHGQGRTIIFCTSIAALRHTSSLLRVLGITVWTLHAQMQQRARLKAVDRFRTSENSILVATDVAARGLDIPGVRTVIHYQLPHSAEVYVHRSGRTARALSDGCSIALISPDETSKFAALCRSFGKESFQQFPTVDSYMPEVTKRVSLARQIDKILRKDSQEKAEKSWFERNAASVEMVLDDNDSEEERVKKHRQKKATSGRLIELQQELKTRLSRPLQPKTFSSRFLAGAGVSPLLQQQLEELAEEKQLGAAAAASGRNNKRRKMAVIGQDCVEPLQALKNAGQVVSMDPKVTAEKKKNAEIFRRKRKEEKKRLHDQRRKLKKKQKEAI